MHRNFKRVVCGLIQTPTRDICKHDCVVTSSDGWIRQNRGACNLHIKLTGAQRLRERLSLSAGIIHDENAPLARNKCERGGDIIFRDRVGGWIKRFKDGFHAHNARARQRDWNGDDVGTRVQVNCHCVAGIFGIKINRLAINFKANSPINWLLRANDHFGVNALTASGTSWRAQRFHHGVVGGSDLQRYNINRNARGAGNQRGLQNISRCLVAIA